MHGGSQLSSPVHTPRQSAMLEAFYRRCTTDLDVVRGQPSRSRVDSGGCVQVSEYDGERRWEVRKISAPTNPHISCQKRALKPAETDRTHPERLYACTSPDTLPSSLARPSISTPSRSPRRAHTSSHSAPASSGSDRVFGLKPASQSRPLASGGTALGSAPLQSAPQSSPTLEVLLGRPSARLRTFKSASMVDDKRDDARRTYAGDQVDRDCAMRRLHEIVAEEV